MKNILIVEDNQDDFGLIKVHLNRVFDSISFTKVSYLEEFKKIIQTKNWDLIICDNGLPDFDALEALEYYAEVKLNSPFLVYHGTLNESKKARAYELGATAVLQKGNFTELNKIISKVFASPVPIHHNVKERDFSNAENIDILVVDKSDFSKKCYELLFEDIDNITLQYVSKLEEACHIVTQTNFDLIFLDADFLDLPLAETIQTIQSSCLKRTKFICCSVHDLKEENKEQLYFLGCVDTYEKPIYDYKLHDLVLKHINLVEVNQ